MLISGNGSCDFMTTPTYKCEKRTKFCRVDHSANGY